MRDFFAFRKFITPTLIQILFWLGTIASIATGIFTIYQCHQAGVMLNQAFPNSNDLTGGPSTFNPSSSMMLPGICFGVIEIVVGPILVRILCEIVINFFRNTETLNGIRDSKGAPPPVVTSAQMGAESVPPPASA